MACLTEEKFTLTIPFYLGSLNYLGHYEESV
jgi:hypothetical protein